MGGLSQMYFLAKISPNLLRFFSVSQLISDGLFMLLFLLIAFLGVIPIYLNKHPNEKKLENYKYTKGLYISAGLFLLFGLATAILKLIENYKVNGLHELVHFITALFIFYSLFYVLLYEFCSQYLGRYFLIGIFFIINSLISVYSYSKINNNTENILNFKTIISTLEQKECYSKTPQILYFNDKYIFIEVEIKGKKSIIIKKTDDLFE